MALSDRINDKFQEWAGDISKGVGKFLVTVTGRGIELVLDIVGKAMKPALMPTVDKLLAQPDLPTEIKEILTKIKTTDGQWQAILLGGLGMTAVGGAASASLFPPLEKLKQIMSKQVRFQVFDYPIVLAAWLRNKEKYESLFEHLQKRGYYDQDIDALKELVWVRLDPDIVQRIWLRDKTANEKFWKDQIGRAHV